MILQTLLPRVLSHTPAGASTKTVIHFGQEVKSGRFQKYDYGSNGNMALYNTTSPPDYDLSKVQVPIGIFWAANDWLASPKVSFINSLNFRTLPFSNYVFSKSHALLIDDLLFSSIKKKSLIIESFSGCYNIVRLVTEEDFHSQSGVSQI